METAPIGERASDVERLPAAERGEVHRRIYRVQLPLDLRYGVRSEGVPGDDGRACAPEEGKQPPEEPVPETPRPPAIEHLQDLFSDIEEWTNKRYPALEKLIEAADIEAQRDFYRLLKSFMMP